MVTRCSPHPSRGQQLVVLVGLNECGRDAARTPHGDSNYRDKSKADRKRSDAARTPHGDSNTSCLLFDHVPRDAARSPHGDSNSVEQMPVTRRVDAARSPHGDSNSLV